MDNQDSIRSVDSARTSIRRGASDINVNELLVDDVVL
jgi:hypothetical protein